MTYCLYVRSIAFRAHEMKMVVELIFY